MNNWAALFRSLTADNVDNVGPTRKRVADNVNTVNNVNVSTGEKGTGTSSSLFHSSTTDKFFACRPCRPIWRRLARFDQLGLVWLTRGRPVTSITAESATIGTPSSGLVSFYRLQARQEYRDGTRTSGGPWRRTWRCGGRRHSGGGASGRRQWTAAAEAA